LKEKIYIFENKLICFAHGLLQKKDLFYLWIPSKKGFALPMDSFIKRICFTYGFLQKIPPIWFNLLVYIYIDISAKSFII